MTVSPTPKPTRKTEVLAKSPPTIVSSREEDAAMKEVSLTRYRCANCILETKTKVGSPVAKAPAPRPTPNINEAPTTPKSQNWVVVYYKSKARAKERYRTGCRYNERLNAETGYQNVGLFAAE